MNLQRCICFCAMAAGVVPVWADGFSLDRVYHPYVEPMEREIEWRTYAYPAGHDVRERTRVDRFGYGQALGERWFVEAYALVGSKGGDAAAAEGWEFELRRQLTEQGEYWADWGLIFELEREHGDRWETSCGVLLEKEHGQWSTALNVLLEAEWGKGVNSELETRLAVQTRYRWSPLFEPAIELHAAEDTLALGPVVLGTVRLGNRRTLQWEAGIYAGLRGDTPDRAFRAGIEFGF